MRKIYSVLCLIIIAGLAGCNKTTIDLPGSGSNSKEVFSVKINGVQKKASFTTATLYKEQSTMQISGQFGGLGSTEAISLSIKDPKVGTFSLNQDADMQNMVLYQSETVYDGYTNVTGKITVTAYTGKMISGTFECTTKQLLGEATKTFTEGSFSCKVMIL